MSNIILLFVIHFFAVKSDIRSTDNKIIKHSICISIGDIGLSTTSPVALYDIWTDWYACIDQSHIVPNNTYYSLPLL